MMIPAGIVAENLKRGSEQAKEFIFVNYYEGFLRTAHRILKSKEDAEDVVSESLFKIFNRVNQLKDSERFLSWCHTMVARDSYNFLRTRRLDSDLEIYDISFYDDFAKAFDLFLIKKEIENLPAGYKTIMKLHCIEGYTGPEVSKMLKIDPGTVRSQVFKGRKLLKAKLGFEY